MIYSGLPLIQWNIVSFFAFSGTTLLLLIASAVLLYLVYTVELTFWLYSSKTHIIRLMLKDSMCNRPDKLRPITPFPSYCLPHIFTFW
jgi:hypothetical protein